MPAWPPVEPPPTRWRLRPERAEPGEDLIAAGADLELVFRIEVRTVLGTGGYLTLPKDVPDLEAAVRLRFRSFPPYVFRAIGQEALLPELRIFDMASALQTITVN